MQIAAIVPIPLLDEVKDRPYHLVLCQWLERSLAYREFFYSQALLRRTLILDNGASEGEQVGIEVLLKYANELRNRGAAVIIAAPDVLWDTEGTWQSTIAGLEEFSVSDWGGKTMVIPQGRDGSRGDWLDSIRSLKYLDFDVWGLTRGSSRAFAGGRLEYARRVVESDPYHRPSHFLGIWDDPYEVYQIAVDPELKESVLGLDSKIFYKMARDGVCLGSRGLDVPYVKKVDHTDMENGRLPFEGIFQLRRNLRVADAWAQRREYGT
jgi:hypothetical protein